MDVLETGVYSPDGRTVDEGPASRTTTPPPGGVLPTQRQIRGKVKVLGADRAGDGDGWSRPRPR